MEYLNCKSHPTHILIIINATIKYCHLGNYFNLTKLCYAVDDTQTKIWIWCNCGLNLGIFMPLSKWSLAYFTMPRLCIM